MRTKTINENSRLYPIYQDLFKAKDRLRKRKNKKQYLIDDVNESMEIIKQIWLNQKKSN